MENGAKNIKAEEVMADKPVEKSQADDVKADKVKNDDIKVEETKNEVAEPETMQTDGAQVEETKVDKPEETKASDEAKPEAVKPEDVKSEEPSEELLEKVKSQLEFYFGDINLQRDKFLIEQTKLDEGWIPLTVMLTFRLLSSMTKEQEVILKAVESSDLIEISEDRKKIRRSPEHPLPVFDEAYRKAQAERTVYIKGFPLTDVYIYKLKEFFKDYEPFENIIMRKYQDKEKKLQFKGSIFIQFKTLEGAKSFMARESVKYGETELIRKFSEDYAVEKAKEKEERKLKKGEKKENKNDENDKDGGGDQTSGFIKGSVIHFKGVTVPTMREVFKEQIEELGGVVAYIDYQKGDTEGWIRLQVENTGKTVIDQMKDNTLTIKDDVVTFRLLEGEEEETYLKNVRKTIKDFRNRNKSGKRGRSRRGRGGGQRGWKRHASPARGGPEKKKSSSGTD